SHGLAIKDFLDRLCQVTACGSGPLIADAELIVDSTLVPHHALLVKDTCLRRAPGAEPGRNDIALVLEDRERQTVVLSVLGDALSAILAVGVDGQELHPLVRIVFRQLGEARKVSVVDGAFGADENNDEYLLVLEICQRYILPGSILEDRVG